MKRKAKAAASLLKAASTQLESVKPTVGMNMGEFFELGDIKKEVDALCERLKTLAR